MRIHQRLVSGVAVAALAAAAMIGTATSASAFTGYTWAPGGPGAFQGMYINGSGRHINYVNEGYDGGNPGSNVCNMGAKWYGDFSTGGWKNYYSKVNAYCELFASSTANYTVGTGWIVNNTIFRGYAKSNLSGGAWTSAVAAKIYQ
jgi:hypothetical protein